MQRPKVKVCGMTRVQDVQGVVAEGVDAIGMILHAQSPRLIDVARAQAIREIVPDKVKLVGVFVDASVELVTEYANTIGLDLIQLHGDESREYIDKLNLPYIKAIRAKSASQVSNQIEQYGSACAILLDPYVKGQHGGTGKQLDLSLWPTNSTHKLVLAGGLNPDNVQQLVNDCQPYGVDLNSGVESRPGVKDIALIKQALAALGR